jgi:glycosyltransferase involved in cell wall biosynthesis
LTVEKGVDTLLAAWGGASDLPPLVIAGEGPLAGEVSAAAARDPRITFAGMLDRAAIRNLMETSAALVFPSRWYEGEPMTILEALAAGLPVIGSRIGSIPGLVTDGTTGKLVPPNDPAALARTVLAASADRRALQAMRVAARAAYEHRHTPDANYARLADIYDRALHRRLADGVPAGLP